MGQILIIRLYLLEGVYERERYKCVMGKSEKASLSASLISFCGPVQSLPVTGNFGPELKEQKSFSPESLSTSSGQ